MIGPRENPDSEGKMGKITALVKASEVTTSNNQEVLSILQEKDPEANLVDCSIVTTLTVIMQTQVQQMLLLEELLSGDTE